LRDGHESDQAGLFDVMRKPFFVTLPQILRRLPQIVTLVHETFDVRFTRRLVVFFARFLLGFFFAMMIS